MAISSRTPEGVPHRCPVCGNESAVEPSYPGGDSCCPSRGHLLWWFRDRLGRGAGASPERVTLSSSFAEDPGLDSLDIVELIMELEEEFDIQMPDDEAQRIRTVADAIRYIEQHRKG
jgi:acyl carrier protein